MTQQLSLDGEDCFFHARGFDEGGWRGGQPGERPFGDAVGRIDGRGVGGFDEVLGNYVDGAFLRGEEVGEGIFGIGDTAGKSDG